jgi:hypothetical protein
VCADRRVVLLSEMRTQASRTPNMSRLRRTVPESDAQTLLFETLSDACVYAALAGSVSESRPRRFKLSCLPVATAELEPVVIPTRRSRLPNRYRVAVTFEYDEKAPETVRFEMSVSNASLGARRAMDVARRQYPNRTWRSLVLLFERLDPTEGRGD